MATTPTSSPLRAAAGVRQARVSPAAAAGCTWAGTGAGSVRSRPWGGLLTWQVLPGEGKGDGQERHVDPELSGLPAEAVCPQALRLQPGSFRGGICCTVHGNEPVLPGQSPSGKAGDSSLCYSSFEGTACPLCRNKLSSEPPGHTPWSP